MTDLLKVESGGRTSMLYTNACSRRGCCDGNLAGQPLQHFLAVLAFVLEETEDAAVFRELLFCFTVLCCSTTLNL